MAVASGPAESIVIAGRRFECDSESAVNLQLSGFSNEVKNFGSGIQRIVKSRVSAKIDSLDIGIDPDKADLEFLQEQRDKLEFLDVTLTMCNGSVYAGSMQITGDIQQNLQENTAGITLEGKLESQ